MIHNVESYTLHGVFLLVKHNYQILLQEGKTGGFDLHLQMGAFSSLTSDDITLMLRHSCCFNIISVTTAYAPFHFDAHSFGLEMRGQLGGNCCSKAEIGG